MNANSSCKTSRFISQFSDVCPRAAEGLVIANRWKLSTKLGCGAFGTVYVARDLLISEQFAAKLEHRGSSTLLCETAVYQAIQADGNTPGFPRILFSGSQGTVQVLIMEQLGISLQGNRMSVSKALSTGKDMFILLERLHKKGFSHGDVSLRNFVRGRPGTAQENDLFLIDFGLCREIGKDTTVDNLESGDFRNVLGLIDRPEVTDMKKVIHQMISTTGGIGLQYLHLFPPQVQRIWDYLNSIPMQSVPDYDLIQTLMGFAEMELLVGMN